jgi:uncharacterized protein YabE (DUF348 family)
MVLLATAVTGLLLINHGQPTFRPSDYNVVILNYDNKQRAIPTTAKTVGDLLNNLDIQLHSGDVVEPAASTPIVGANFRINVYRAVPVTIIDGDQETFTYSAAVTPRTIAEQAGIVVYPEDTLQLLPATNFLADDAIGEEVIIYRATPINVNLYGTPVIMRTHATTVGGLMTDEGIKLGNGDSVTPAPTTPIVADMQVFLVHRGTQIITVSQSIPAPVQTVQDNSLSFGTQAVRQQGTPGTELITYQLQLQNGQEISRTEIQQVVTVQPVPQIIAEGQAVQIPSDQETLMALAGISQSDYRYVNYIISNESGWCPTKVQGDIGYCPSYAPSDPSILEDEIGLGQATPGDKMAPFGAGWETNPVTQLEWASNYADTRYGSWSAAYNHWVNYHNW